MRRKCPVCGKRFWCDWPGLWAYKRDKLFLCSWSCIREYDRKEAEMMERKRMTREEKRKAIEMALAGDNPLPYLKEIGLQNPTIAWRSIRAWAAQEMGTEEAAKLPEKFGKGTGDPEVQLVCDPGIAEEYRQEQEQKEADREQMTREEKRTAAEIAEEYRKEQEQEEARTERTERILGQEPLEPAALFSRVLECGTWRKVQGMGMMLQGPEVQIILSVFEWAKLSAEILVAIRQLKADEPDFGDDED